MKKLLSTLLVFALVLTLVTPAFAATELTAAEKYEALEAAGIFKGTANGADLEANIDRATVASIVARLMELDQPAVDPTFADTKGHWAQNTIEAVKAAGFMSGVGGDNFAPNKQLSFEELASLLVKVQGLDYVEAKVEGKVSAWANNAVATVLAAGLIAEQADYTVLATRGDLAVTTYTIYEELNPVEVTVESVTAVGANKLDVKFNTAVDASKASVVVKKGSFNVNVKEVTFAADKTTATIVLATKLTKGEYTVVVSNVSDSDLTGKVTAEDEKVGKIEFTADKAVLDGADAKVVTVPFKVSNQYGEDITRNASLSFTASKGATVPAYATGVLTLDNNGTTNGATNTVFNIDEKVAITALNASTGTFASTTVTVSPKAQVADIEITELYNVDGYVPTAGDTGSDYKLVIVAKDQYGNKVPAANIASGVIVTVSDASKANIDGTASTPNFVSNTDVNNDGVNETTLSLNGTLVAGKSVITIISKTTGDLASYTVDVKEGSVVDELSLSAPALAVAGEKFEIPFTAVDQFGDAITKASVLTNGMTSIEASFATGKVAFEQDYVKGTAKLVVDATTLSAKQTIVITGITGKNKVVQLSVNVLDPAEPTVISGLKNATINLAEGATSTLTTANVVINDQYGRDYSKVVAPAKAVLGSNAADYMILASTSDALKVSLTGTTLNTTGDTVVLGGVDKGSSSITLKLQKGDGSADIANSEYTFTSKVVEKADITSYELVDFDTLYEISGTTHDVDVTVNGILADGSKVVVPTSYYTVTENDTQVSYSAGVLDSIAGYAWGTATERTVPVIVTVNGANGAVVLTKNVTVSNVSPKVETMTLVTNGVATKEADGVVSVSVTVLNGHGNAATLADDAIKAVDQYGVEISTDVWDGTTGNGSVVVTNYSHATRTIGSLVAGDTFNVTAISATGKVLTFKVITK